RSSLHAQPDIHLLRSLGQLDLYVVDRRHYVPPLYAVPLSNADAARRGRQRAAGYAVSTALGVSTAGVAGAGQLAPRVIDVSWTQENPTRWSAHVGPTAGPIVLVLSALYHPFWHACVLPANAVVLPWTCWFNGFMPASAHV